MGGAGPRVLEGVEQRPRMRPDYASRIGERVSTQTFAPHDNGLSGEYTTVDGPSISTARHAMVPRDVLTLIGGSKAPVFVFRRTTCWFTWIRFRSPRAMHRPSAL